MKLKEGFTLENRDGQNVICCNDKSSDFNSLIILNETSAFLFNTLAMGEKTAEELLKALLQRFDISTVLALNDIDVFIKTLKENGVIEE